MELLAVQPKIEAHCFIKNPESSTLGRNMVQQGISLMDELGFESFTFKKLGERIHSNESSIYRYFESKHQFLQYIAQHYWAWLEYRLVFQTHNLHDPKEKLVQAIILVTQEVEDDSQTQHINERLLHRVMIKEFGKVWNQRNAHDMPIALQRIMARIADMIAQAAPQYLFGHDLAVLLVEGGHFQSEWTPNQNDSNRKTEFFIDLFQRSLSL